MYDDGKRLEGLVALIEKLHLPSGFDVKTNKKVYNQQGIQIAEFDIEITGKLGTTDIVWLIECRDRPSEGPAPGSWIEQLVARRSRFGFSKVTAVSTTGFAKGAVAYAKEKGIEIREVKSLTPEAFADWLQVRSMTRDEPSLHLVNAALIINAQETKERQEAFQEAVETKTLKHPVLRSIDTNETISALTALSRATHYAPYLFDGVLPNQPATSKNLRISYPNDDSHFVVDTNRGAIRIAEIIFTVELTVKETEVPLVNVREYTHAESGESISQSAAFVFEALNTKLSLEMHKLTGSSGETKVVLRNLGKVT